MTHSTLQERLQDAVSNFMQSPANSLGDTAGHPAFESPLIGFARGDDPLFDDFKHYVGPFHWTPQEAFELIAPGSETAADQLTVIAWILPQTARTKEENRRERWYPAESWARSRIIGETVNEALRRLVVDFFAAEDILALAPSLHPSWSRMDSPDYVWASKWSERHQAYAAGLGTFGICDGLITPVGKAVRVGSVVARTTALPITPRPYTNHRSYCLQTATGTCLQCAERCPVGAISEAGHDKRVCREHVHETCRAYVHEQMGLEGYACGLCQTGVPCESGIPVNDFGS